MQYPTKATGSKDIVMRGKGPQGQPYTWAHKESIWRMRRGFDNTTYLDQALAVYSVHCELASDAQSASYSATLRKIAERAGVSVRRVTDINRRLKALDLLTWQQQFIEGTKELGENLYTLLMYGTACHRSGRDEKTGNCRVLEQSNEQSLKERYNVARASQSPSAPSNAPSCVQRPTQASETLEDGILIARCKSLLGKDEWDTHDGQWCKLIRKYPIHIKSGLDALSDRLEKTNREPIENRASWLVGYLKNKGCDVGAETIPGK